MNCRELERICTSYVDGELDERRASAVRGHLRSCSDCQQLVGDEALIREAAEELGQKEPPAELWLAIEARIASEEVRDGQRSRAWFWWQSLRDYALPTTVGVVAVAAILLWFTRSEHQHAELASGADSHATPPAGAIPGAAPGSLVAVPLPLLSFDEAREREFARTEQRYQKVLRELRAMLEEERAHWSPQEAAVFDRRTADLQRKISEQESRLAASNSTAPSDRDALYASYRAEIDMLERASAESILR